MDNLWAQGYHKPHISPSFFASQEERKTFLKEMLEFSKCFGFEKQCIINYKTMWPTCHSIRRRLHKFLKPLLNKLVSGNFFRLNTLNTTWRELPYRFLFFVVLPPRRVEKGHLKFFLRYQFCFSNVFLFLEAKPILNSYCFPHAWSRSILSRSCVKREEHIKFCL